MFTNRFHSLNPFQERPEENAAPLSLLQKKKKKYILFTISYIYEEKQGLIFKQSFQKLCRVISCCLGALSISLILPFLYGANTFLQSNSTSSSYSGSIHTVYKNKSSIERFQSPTIDSTSSLYFH